MAKKLIAIEVDYNVDEARVLALANAVWDLMCEHLDDGDGYVCVQGFDAPGWDDSDVTIRVSAPKVRPAL